MLRIIFISLIGVLTAASLGATSTYSVLIDTSGINGYVGELVFDFLSGGGPVNAASILGFSSDGALGDASTQSTTGDVFGTGTGPVFISPGSVVLIDDTGFSEYVIGFTFGSTISFTLNASQNAPGPNPPDELSLFFLDTDGMTPLITTNDPTGSNSLLTLDIDGSTNGISTVYPANDGSGVTATMTPQSSGGSSVPEPSTWPVLLAVGLLARFTSLGRALKGICNLTTPLTRDSLD